MENFFVVVDDGTYSAEGLTFAPGRHPCENKDVLAAVKADGLGHVRIEWAGKEITTAEVEAELAKEESGTLDKLATEEFECPTCNRKFTTSSGLARHITIAHDPSKSVEPPPAPPSKAKVEETASAASVGPGAPVKE